MRSLQALLRQSMDVEVRDRVEEMEQLVKEFEEELAFRQRDGCGEDGDLIE